MTARSFPTAGLSVLPSNTMTKWVIFSAVWLNRIFARSESCLFHCRNLQCQQGQIEIIKMNYILYVLYILY